MRIKQLEKILTGSFFSLLFGLAYFQLIEGEHYRIQSQENVIRLVPSPAPRGIISDRNGAILADHRLTFDVAIIPQEVKDPAELIERLSHILKTDPNTLLQAYSRGTSIPFMPVTLLEDVPKEEAIALLEHRDLPGVVVVTTPKRHYPYGGATVHLLGTLGEIAPRELERLRPYGYRLKDVLGRGGIEEAFDNYLRGRDGGTQFKVNSRGYKVATLGYRPPQKGKDLVLTLDIRLQNFIHSLLEGKRGAVCVMNPQTGEILALVSSPSFDPNEDVAAFLQAEGRPFVNRVTQGYYPPGSTFKVVVGTAALEEKKITPETTFTCPGVLRLGNTEFRCWREGGHGPQNLVEALRHSCNIYFYRLGLLTGPERITEYAHLFGFGESSHLELPHEAIGLVPHPLWKRLTKREAWYDGDTVNFAIGQGYLSATPLQLLRMVSVIAADGKLVQPYLVKQIGPHEVRRAKFRPLPFSKENVGVVRRGMIEVVNTPDGTGRYAAVAGLDIAGKTGTAQVEGREPHAWFAGFSPFKEPRVSLVVLVEHGGMGGLVTSQMAAEIFEKMAELQLL